MLASLITQDFFVHKSSFHSRSGHQKQCVCWFKAGRLGMKLPVWGKISFDTSSLALGFRLSRVSPEASSWCCSCGNGRKDGKRMGRCVSRLQPPEGGEKGDFEKCSSKQTVLFGKVCINGHS